MPRRCFVVVLLLLLYCSGHGIAQSSQGRISGRITDSTGAILPATKITVLNVDTHITRALVTGESGDYTAVSLEPGVYQIIAERDGFARAESKAVRLEVASNLRLDFVLKPGSVTEVVEVSEDQLLIDTQSTTLGGTITNTAINELPLQGRDFQNLLMLRPGVQRTPGGGLLSVTSNGNRPTDNNYIVDGTDDNDIYYGDTVVNGVGVQGTPATHLPLDAIQEFNSQQNQGAEYGWKPGAVVNIGLKSGTDTLHGTAYYFHRNNALDARNYFNDASEPQSALLLHQFGASLGGPIRKDKWFYFFNYEGTRDKVGNPGYTSSPVTSSLLSQGEDSDTASTYSLADAMAGCTQKGGTSYDCSDLSLTLSKIFLTNPGNSAQIASGGDPSLIDFDFANTNREDNLVLKTDYRLNDAHTVSASFFYGNSHQIEEDTTPLRPEFLSYAQTHVMVGGASWVWTPANNWVHQVRFGMNQNWQYINSVDSNVDPTTTYGINTGITGAYYGGLPAISISPFDYLGGNYNWPLRTTPNHTMQFSDNTTWTHGRHTVQFGGEFRNGGTDNFRAQYGRGRIRFRSLENFLQGNVYRAYLMTGDPHRSVTMSAAGGFLRDDWRVSSHITLSAGLRYDFTTPVKEANNQLANFIPGQGLIQVGHGIDSPYNAQKANFGPRAGIVWDMRGNGTTVLRAGASYIFEQPSIRTFLDKAGLGMNPSGASGVTPGTGNMTTFSRTLSASDVNWSSSGPVFDVTSMASASCSSDDPCNVFGVLQDLKNPSVFSWNVNVEQKITRNMALQVAYVGSQGINLYSHRDINQVDPSVDDGSEQYGRPYTYNCPSPTGGDAGGLCYPWAGYVFYVENLGSSIYHSMQVTLTQKSWKGWDFLAGYTWAHAIDTGSSDRTGYPQDSNNFQALRGNGDYDIRHRFTFSSTYNLPESQKHKLLTSGWQTTTILTVEGGEPFDLYDSYNDISETATYGNEHWNFHGNAKDVYAGHSHLPYYDFSDDANSNSACLKYSTEDMLTSYGCYVSGTAVITPQDYGTFGNMGRNIFRGPKFVNWDMSLARKIQLREHVVAQIRAEVFNILNHPNFDVFSMDTDLSDTSSVGQVRFTPDVGAANPVIGSGGSRHMQLGAKIIW